MSARCGFRITCLTCGALRSGPMSPNTSASRVPRYRTSLVAGHRRSSSAVLVCTSGRCWTDMAFRGTTPTCARALGGCPGRSGTGGPARQVGRSGSGRGGANPAAQRQANSAGAGGDRVDRWAVRGGTSGPVRQGPTLVIGLQRDRHELDEALATRVHDMFDAGLVGRRAIWPGWREAPRRAERSATGRHSPTWPASTTSRRHGRRRFVAPGLRAAPAGVVSPRYRNQVAGCHRPGPVQLCTAVG